MSHDECRVMVSGATIGVETARMSMTTLSTCCHCCNCAWLLDGMCDNSPPCACACVCPPSMGRVATTLKVTVR
eukprot:scaffold14316_cov116-Isochrysis_galbana.AAC.1